MAAPRNNNFWLKRTKHGRDKIFASPEDLLAAAYEYFTYVDKSPWLQVEQRKGQVIIPKDIQGLTKKEREKLTDMAVYLPTARPYTLVGLCIYLGVNTKYFNDFEKGLKEKPHKGFSEVICTIKDIIYAQKFEGGCVGAFNANLISRELGIADMTKVAGPNGEPLPAAEYTLTLKL